MGNIKIWIYETLLALVGMFIGFSAALLALAALA
tara:strand:- start:263 stop:364 length:102 start_codon:yes stop_codon:yes gene_type:complete